MTRDRFTQDMQRLQTDTSVLGTMVATGLTEAVHQLCARDRPASERLVVWDRQVNERSNNVQMATLAVIATQQPVATDVRLLSSVFETAGELERIGDYAKGIARINLLLDDAPFPWDVNDTLERMAAKSREMLERSMDAFQQLDVAQARTIILEDDEVDALFIRVFQVAIHSNGLAAADDNGRSLERANYLMWAAHNLERSADRVTNICQRVVFTVTGDVADLDRS